MLKQTQRTPKYGLHKASGRAVVYLDGRAVYLGRHGSEESLRAYDRPIQHYLTTRKPAAVPPLRVHKADGRAVVTLNGHDVYLGRHGTPESVELYRRTIAAWLDNGRRWEGLEALRGEGPPIDGITINEVMARYLRDAQSAYPNSHELKTIVQALKPLKQLWGSLPAAQFSPLKLKRVRQQMIGMGWCRSNIGRQINRIRAMFRWAESDELIPKEKGVCQSLRSVKALRPGEDGVAESEEVKPVPEADRLAIRPHVSRQVWTICALQRLTGARPGELLRLRPVDLEDRDRDTWTLRLRWHKTAHRDPNRKRFIKFGPEAQQLLRPFLEGRAPDAFLFSPIEAEAERQAQRRLERQSQVQPSQVRRSEEATRRPRRRPPQDHYTVDSYRRAIARACQQAGSPHWFPYQLRHSAGTAVARRHGFDATRAFLGQKSLPSTFIYAEIDEAQATEIATEMG